MKRGIFGLCLGLAIASTAGAEAIVDPDWPCVQRKQPHLSVGQVWVGPLPDAATEVLAKRADISALAQALQQRRLPMPDAETQIARFAADANAQELTALFLAAFNEIDRYRTQIIGGIARYARKQTELSAQIEERRAEMSTLAAEANPDFDKIDEAEAKLDWDTRIFTDRQQSLSYVCETPVLLEQRAFALAQAIAAHLP
ncbi:MAG: hypothetical protein WCC57_15400 [Paracoccaceae bacterium]